MKERRTCERFLHVRQVKMMRQMSRQKLKGRSQNGTRFGCKEYRCFWVCLYSNLFCSVCIKPDSFPLVAVSAQRRAYWICLTRKQLIFSIYSLFPFAQFWLVDQKTSSTFEYSAQLLTFHICILLTLNFKKYFCFNFFL